LGKVDGVSAQLPTFWQSWRKFGKVDRIKILAHFWLSWRYIGVVDGILAKLAEFW
jgi:hypothetical protein